MEKERIYDEILLFLSSKLKINKEKLSKETYFSVDLGFSSFDSLEFICDIEENFHCVIPQKKILMIHTIEDLVNVIDECTKEEAA